MDKKWIVDVNVYKSTILKEDKSQNEIEETFGAYHSIVERTFEIFDGKCWHKKDEGRIFLFLTPNDAVDAALRLLDNMILFNAEKNQLSFAFLLRIGVHEIETKNIANIPEHERDNYVNETLGVVRELQRNCPVGKIVISKEVYEKIQRTKDIFRPSFTLELSKRKAFVLRRRAIMPHEDFLLCGLLDEQKISIPSIPFPTWDKIVPDENISLTILDKILEQPLLVILGETSSFAQGPIVSAATSDAVGIIKLIAGLSNKEVIAGIDQWEDTADFAVDHNILLVGSGTVNTYAFALNDIIKPVHFVKTKGRVFDCIVTSADKGRIYFGPHTSSPKECGIVAIFKNPFNLDKTLVWIGGITGWGTHAASIFAQDLIRDSQETFCQRTGNSSIHPIACVVSASRSEGIWGTRLRTQDYKILWMCDQYGKTFEPLKQ